MSGTSVADSIPKSYMSPAEMTDAFFIQNIQEITILQNVLRGFIDRKRSSVALSSLVHSKPELTLRRMLDFFEKKDISCLKNYLTFESSSTENRLGPFAYASSYSGSTEVFSQGPIVMHNGSIYTGEWNSLLERHGKGTQIWTNGSKYEGFWRNDSPHGQGRLIHPDGNFYEGG